MAKIKHGEIPKWYNTHSKYEALFHEDSPNEKITNQSIEKILKKYHVNTVLDITCGTGSQVFWLLKQGFTVVGSDISPSMLKIAKQKARQEKLDVEFHQGDMRDIGVGTFDAVITIFNAVGHLTKAHFEKTMRNVYNSLHNEGIFIFDILNLTFVNHNDNISKLSLERIKTHGDAKIREIQHSVLDSKGILTSYTTSYTQKESGRLKTSNIIATLQLYTAKELQEMLVRNGFKVLGQYGIDGSKFSEQKTERILTIARKE